MNNDKSAVDSIKAAQELLDMIKEGKIESKDSLEHYKRQVCGKYHLAQMFSNSLIIEQIPDCIDDTERNKLLRVLTKRKTRTISGISVVAVMTPPAPCPGNCIYCPKGENAAQSYTGKEPAAMRGIQNKYDPYAQVKARIDQLRSIGHPANKIHLIIMGGTFLAQTQQYQDDFMLGCFNAMLDNNYGDMDTAIKQLETSQIKNVGITFETRPDHCFEEHVDRMLTLGGTWVEIGVQTLDPDILAQVHRGHTITDVKRSVRVAKDAGLKVTIHMMPNLFSTPEQDKQMFHELFQNPAYKPDSLKIYPTLVIKGTELYDMWKAGTFKPYPEQDIVKMMAEVKDEILPEWVRIMRIQRDIPAYLIEDGVQHGNLREIIHEYMAKRQQSCKCIRCREIGHRMRKEDYEPDVNEMYIKTIQYEASGGKEYFLSYVDAEDTLFGFIRLRLTKNSHRPEAKGQHVGFIRELHVYGSEVAAGTKPDSKYAWQHKGLGQELLEQTEQIARDVNVEKVLVTSGIGVREYYANLGYELEGAYMVKRLKK